MSGENVELVRQAWAAYAEGGLDAAVDHYAEDCVVEDFPEMADRATYGGTDGLRKRETHFRESWGDFGVKPVEFIDAGDAVVVVLAMSVRGLGSGASLETRPAFVYQLRKGKIVADSAFTSRTQALEAVGLLE